MNIWKLRVTNFRDDILQRTGDFEAAFHRIPYQPDLAICFAYVSPDFVVSPAQTVFWYRGLPGMVWANSGAAYAFCGSARLFAIRQAVVKCRLHPRSTNQ